MSYFACLKSTFKALWAVRQAAKASGSKGPPAAAAKAEGAEGRHDKSSKIEKGSERTRSRSDRDGAAKSEKSTSWWNSDSKDSEGEWKDRVQAVNAKFVLSAHVM